jgi:hypothetical protein
MMDAIAWLTAIYVALWVGVYAPDFNKQEPTTTKEVRELEDKTK